MSNVIKFSAVRSNAKNDGQLEQDDKGYYKVILGVLNATNSRGEVYLDKGVSDLITVQSHSLARRLAGGYLKGEAGHPPYEPGMSKHDFFIRNMDIRLDNVSHHIRDIMLTTTNNSSGVNGVGTQVLVEAWIKPSGPMGDSLKAALDDPDQNVAFSIRCFTNNENVNGTTFKTIVQIVTWDWVLEPGMAAANKWNKLSVESMDILTIDLDEITTVDNQIAESFNISLESADQRDMLQEILDSTKRSSSKFDILHKW